MRKIEVDLGEIAQADFDYAVRCLESAKQDNAIKYNFPYPYFAPGGAYGAQWWQLDSSLALGGYKWLDWAFAERALKNFTQSQKKDGRICLYGADVLPKYVAGGNELQQMENVSSLPKVFDIAYHVLQGSRDAELKKSTYSTLKKYLLWWFSARQDDKTGLISSVFEETFIPYLGKSGEYAGVDTNVEVYVGCHYTELLARELGEAEDAEYFKSKKEKLKESINRYLWNEQKGGYYAYFIKEERSDDRLMASTFYPLRLGIAPKERREKLITLLKDDERFNWNTFPLTSVSKTDPVFKTTRGEYQGNDSWSGNVWTLINEMVVRGLSDVGERELAAELAFKTLRAFRSNCSEFINPFDGSGQGVIEYAWTASQFISLIVEVVFGVSFNAEGNEVEISPCVPNCWKDKKLSIKGLSLGERTLDVFIENGCGSFSVS